MSTEVVTAGVSGDHNRVITFRIYSMTGNIEIETTLKPGCFLRRSRTFFLEIGPELFDGLSDCCIDLFHNWNGCLTAARIGKGPRYEFDLTGRNCAAFRIF